LEYELLATTIMGLESVLSRELTDLGYENKIPTDGRVRFHGDELAICEANVWLRTAGRVLLVVDRFEAKDFDTLFERTKSAEWERWIPPMGSFHVRGRSVKSDLSSVPACQRTVKKAIAERLLKAHDVSELPESGETYDVEISLVKNEAILTLDTSGSGLHRRGYRRLVGEAPLRETIAAGLILLSFWKPGRPLIDPFCGSGTIPIEAAMIGRNIAPGLKREFAAEAWTTFPRELWDQTRRVAKTRIEPELEERIVGTDISEEALNLARYHARRAGVEGDIHFQRREFSELLSKRAYGCVVTNPPYAMRMGEWDEVAELYESMPNILRRLKTWSHFIFTAYPEFERLVGQQADRRRKLYNSRIECTYFQYYGPRPPREGEERNSHVVEKPIKEGEEREPRVVERPMQETALGDESASPSARTSTTSPAATTSSASARSGRGSPQAFGGVGDKGREQAEVFANRLRKTSRHMRRWPTKRGITCFRLYDRDIPDTPLCVDRYEDCLHIAEYERPHDRTSAEHTDWLDLMAKTAGQVLEIPRERVFLKHRERQRGQEQYERFASRAKKFVVNEGGLKFRVNLSDYLDTGLFLDHRNTRDMVRKEAEGKRFLNLFCYTGSFTAYAANGGAATTTSIDLSSTYLRWTRDNLRLNDIPDAPHELIKADASEFMRRLPREPLFDLAMVDPPTFSNSKSTETDWDVGRRHVELLNEVLMRLSPGGVLYFSTNFRRFKLDESALLASQIREISNRTVPEDFRNKRIHRCWRMVKGE
jgi:23S rRNA (guanine2445-N2)-methyltransferase / 23S rRNA (guanine2069-N7)-methyltransferase